MDALVKITLTGEAGPDAAARLRLELLDALRGGAGATVDLSALSEISLACVQTLVSARRTFARKNAPFTITDSPSGVWRASVAAAGLTNTEEAHG